MLGKPQLKILTDLCFRVQRDAVDKNVMKGRVGPSDPEVCSRVGRDVVVENVIVKKR